MHKRTAWSDYFTGSVTTYNSETYGTRRTLSGTGVHVLNCLFRSITSPTSDGGAIYCTSVTYLLVESTSFFTCKTSSSQGGAIYFSNSNGQCVLHEVCGYDCCSTYTSYSYYQFAYIYVNDGLSSKNYMNYSSIVRCVNLRTDSHYTLRLSWGKICCPSVNISMNKCQWYSGIYFYSSVDSNSFTCSFSFTTFSDNTANGHTCIHPWGGGGNRKVEFKSCNILRNTQGSLSSTGTFYSIDNLMIKDSCILENKADYIFHASSYTITVSNCTLDSTSKTGSVVIQNTVTKSFIHALNHMSTRNCNAEYDSAGYLTPNIQTPSPSKKQKLYCSCEKSFYQPLSFAIIFVFNFIHPYASIDLLY
jgi:predicted outer membrane repeat protein